VDFFTQQEAARRNTRLLVLLFCIAVFGLILLTNGLVAGFLLFSEDYNLYAGSRGGLQAYLQYFSWERFGSIGLAVTLTVAVVALANWIRLSTGGRAVAESMGGRQVLPDTDSDEERRCLNIVHEMSLAANMPAPALFVLEDERGINAFAAGTSPADAVVAVTAGTLRQLRRDELQGVIAHEFSHILNGDMRLNIRLAALLKGITFIGDVGHLLLRSGTRRRGYSGRKDSPALPLLGLGLLVVGWIGGVAAGFIKAAISRQKEFLADASAVQFTRDPTGIGNALKVIGGHVPGTLVHAARAVELSHIFFGQVNHHLWQLFATHPPLEQRIRRIDPAWDGEFITRRVSEYRGQPTRAGDGAVGVGRAAIVAAAIAAANSRDAEFGEPAAAGLQGEAAPLPEHLGVVVKEPLGATAAVFALLLSPEQDVYREQLRCIESSGVQGQADFTIRLMDEVHALHPGQRFPLVALAMPTLKTLSVPQYRVFKDTLLALIRADRRTDLGEWCLFQLVRHYLDPVHGGDDRSRPRHRHLRKVAYHLRVVLSLFAHEGSGDPVEAFTEAAISVDLPALTLMPREQISIADFSRAVHELADCYPLLKARILRAMVLAAEANRDVCVREREIIVTVAAIMDCPLPDGIALGFPG
jgi:Zn-dependent protease with chaperone function